MMVSRVLKDKRRRAINLKDDRTRAIRPILIPIIIIPIPIQIMMILMIISRILKDERRRAISPRSTTALLAPIVVVPTLPEDHQSSQSVEYKRPLDHNNAVVIKVAKTVIFHLSEHFQCNDRLHLQSLEQGWLAWVLPGSGPQGSVVPSDTWRSMWLRSSDLFGIFACLIIPDTVLIMRMRTWGGTSQ